jgi:hypothetical protein
MRNTASELPNLQTQYKLGTARLHFTQERPFMATLLRDARFAFRLFSQAPAFTSLAVGVLALGISSTTAIFSVVYGTFFAPLPYRDPEALVMVWSQFRGERVPVSAKDYVVWKRAATAFEDLNAWRGRSVNLAAADRPENVQAGVATPGFLAMLGYGHPLALGRSFLEDEGTVGRDRVVILTAGVHTGRAEERQPLTERDGPSAPRGDDSAGQRQHGCPWPVSRAARAPA